MREIDIDILPVYLDKIKKQIKKHIDNDLKKYSLSYMHAMNLMCLYKNEPGLTLNELTNKIGVDKANTTRAIVDLIEKGYVIKENKIRGFKITLTDKGLEIAKEFYCNHKKHNETIFSEFSENEIGQMIVFLKRIINKLYEEEKDEENFKNS